MLIDTTAERAQAAATVHILSGLRRSLDKRRTCLSKKFHDGVDARGAVLTRGQRENVTA